MELREFVTKAIVEIIEGVDSASFQEYRDIHLIALGNEQKIMFDVAVAVEGDSPQRGQGSGKGSVVVGAGAARPPRADAEVSRVTRLRFGVHVDRPTPEQIQQRAEMLIAWRTPRRHR